MSQRPIVKITLRPSRASGFSGVERKRWCLSKVVQVSTEVMHTSSPKPWLQIWTPACLTFCAEQGLNVFRLPTRAIFCSQKGRGDLDGFWLGGIWDIQIPFFPFGLFGQQNFQQTPQPQHCRSFTSNKMLVAKLDLRWITQLFGWCKISKSQLLTLGGMSCMSRQPLWL